MDNLVFYAFAALALISALMVVTMQNLVRSIFIFFISLFSMAGLYVFALADFIALTQIVIYAGGVLVLMLFAFMLSNKELLSGLEIIRQRFRFSQFIALLVCIAILIILLLTLSPLDPANFNWIKNANRIQAGDNTVNQIGILTMTRYLLPFEVVSIFLMMALVGAAHLSRKGPGS